MAKQFHKLVRDRIPEIIRQDKQIPVTTILNDDEYKEALTKKLGEEVQEFQSDHTPEELADILEIIYALAATHGISREGLEKMRAEKEQKRGGFQQKIFLIEIQDQP